MPKGLPSFKCCRSLSNSPSTEVKNPPREPYGRQGEKRGKGRHNIQNKGKDGAIDAEEGGREGRREGETEKKGTWVSSRSISGMLTPAVSLLRTSREKSSLLSTRRRTSVPWGGMAPPPWEGKERGEEGGRG